MSKYLKISFYLLISLIILLFNDYTTLGIFYFYFLIIIVAFDIIIIKKINLLNVWNIAFLFIIISEVFSPKFSQNSYSLLALQYLTIANNILNMGYISVKNKSVRNELQNQKNLNKTSKYTLLVFLVLVIFYFLMRIKNALLTFTIGRNVSSGEIEDSLFIGSILNALGFVLPAIIAFYFVKIKNTSYWKALLLSSPIFIILFLNGTRFPLLFSLLGFVIVLQSKFLRKFTFKNYFYIGFMAVMLLFAANLMKHLRSSTTKDSSFSAINSFDNKMDVPTYVTGYFSPEGIIDMTTLMFRYFEHKQHLYGSSSSFLLYFWVPRVVWPDKPQMLGYWFIREFRGGFSSGHSASFGFTGDLYADFGLFSLIIIFFNGQILKIADNFKNKALKSNGYEVILGAMIFPYVFFFVRSPITATMNFMGVLFFYFLLKKIIIQNSNR